MDIFNMQKVFRNQKPAVASQTSSPCAPLLASLLELSSGPCGKVAGFKDS